jgi:ribosomal protein S18 acetylase RimI-like enzyme
MAVRLRSLEAGDVGLIEGLLRANAPVFSESEVETAVSMLRSGLPSEQASAEAYRVLIAEKDGNVAGFALFAKTPLTLGTFDLYWIATDPTRHGRGVGQALLHGVEDAVRGEGGRLLVIETSSRADYTKARRFYEAAGYTRAAVLSDYYREGDHKVIYMRRLDR